MRAIAGAPDLEEDIALANIALDLLGQARLLLARAAAADPSVVPALPEGSPVPVEDALAFFREAIDYRNVRLVEVANGDFAQTIARLLLFATVRLAAFERLVDALRPGAGRDRGQGRQGADLPPGLRRPVVPHPGPGHRGVAAPAARRAGPQSGRSYDRAARRPTRPGAVDVVLDQVFAVSGVERPER